MNYYYRAEDPQQPQQPTPSAAAAVAAAAAAAVETNPFLDTPLADFNPYQQFNQFHVDPSMTSPVVTQQQQQPLMHPQQYHQRRPSMQFRPHPMYQQRPPGTPQIPYQDHPHPPPPPPAYFYHHHPQQPMAVAYPNYMQQSSPIPTRPPPIPQQPSQKRKIDEFAAMDFPAPPKRVKQPEDPNAPPKPKRKTGLNKPLILSPELSAFVGGDTELSRPDIVKRLWKYIKDNDLQDPADRRFILCDDQLKTIFDQDRINSFGMNRDLSAHLTKKPEPEPAMTTTEEPSASVMNTSPAVTAETPDVVTPKEGEGMLPTTSAPA
ncbi:hypothetical protein BJV82DRAFT_585165 [Fennellomyces sp. T-0311]|nr:hypothetical protein BJV82DRAFT_585165 [Fennellomyces sp. T-0311]